MAVDECGRDIYLCVDRNWVGLVLPERGEDGKTVVFAAFNTVGAALVFFDFSLEDMTVKWTILYYSLKVWRFRRSSR